MSTDPTPTKNSASSSTNSGGTTGKQITNPAFRALGLNKIKLPSRNWLIFWTILAASLSGVAYDKYQQRQIVNRYVERVKPLTQKPWPIDKLPRKVTVFVAPPPDDYLETSLKVWRRFVKPILYYAGLDYNVVQEDSQGVIRTTVAEEIRRLRRRRGEQEGDQKEEAVMNAKDIRDVLGIFYERKKMDRVIREDELISDDQSYLSGGVICVGRGAYKEYITGIHEGLLGPLEPPKPLDTESDSNSESAREEPSGKVLPLQQSQPPVSSSPEDKPTDVNADAGVDADANSMEDSGEDSKEEKKKDSKTIPRYIQPDQYKDAQFPPPEFPQLDSTHPIRDPETNIPLWLHQPLLMISLPSLSGFLNIPRRIYRFYRRRYFVESVCEQTLRLVNEEPIRPFVNPDDLQLGLAEEQDWPKGWVKRGLQRESEWTRDFVGDSRVTALMYTYNDRVLDEDRE